MFGSYKEIGNISHLSMAKNGLIPKKYDSEHIRCEYEEDDPEFADPDNPDIAFENFTIQMSKVQAMVGESTVFDFPPSKNLYDILSNFSSSLYKQNIPIEYASNDLFLAFLESVLNTEMENHERKLFNIAQIFVFFSMYQYSDRISLVLKSWPYFFVDNLHNSVALQKYVMALGNILVDPSSHQMLLDMGIHRMLFDLIMKYQLDSITMTNCLNFFFNLSCFFISNQIVIEIDFFNHLTLYLLNFIQLKSQEKKFGNIPNALKILYCLIGNANILEFALKNNLQNCISFLFQLKEVNCAFYEFCILQVISMKLQNESPIFSDESFYQIFKEIYLKSESAAKCEAINLLISLLPSFYNEIVHCSILDTILTNFENENFDVLTHIGTFGVVFISRPQTDQKECAVAFMSLFVSSLLSQDDMLSLHILSFFFQMKQNDPEFWDPYLINNGFLNIFEEFANKEDGDENVKKVAMDLISSFQLCEE